MDIGTAILLLDNWTKFLQDYKTTIEIAEKLVLQLNFEPMFKVTHIIRKKN